MTPPPTPRFSVPCSAFLLSVDSGHAWVVPVQLCSVTLELRDAWVVTYWGYPGTPDATKKDRFRPSGDCFQESRPSGDCFQESRLYATVQAAVDAAKETLVKAKAAYVAKADAIFSQPIAIADAEGKRWTSPFPYVEFVAVEEK